MLKYGTLSLMLFYDLFFFYAAAKILADTGNPYDFYQYSSYVESLGLKLGYLPPFPYPAWSLVLIYPLAIAPFHLSAAMLTCTTLALCSTISLRIVRTLHILNELSCYKIYFLILAFTPLLKTVAFGQISWIVFVAIGGTALLAEKKRYFLAGAVLALTSMKPHISGPIILFALVANYLAKNKGFLPGFILGMIFLIGSSFLLLQLTPSEYISLFSFSPHKDVTNPILTSAPLGWIAQIVSQKWVNIMAVSLGILSSIFLALSIPFNANSLLLVVAPLALILAPYSWSHDFLLLLPLALCGLDKLIISYSERAALYYWIGWLLISILTILWSEWAFSLLCLPLISVALRNFEQLYLASSAPTTN